MNDLGPFHYFLGIQVSHITDSILLHQAKYDVDLLKCDLMHKSKPISTPMSQKFKSNQNSTPYKDPHHYYSLVGTL